MDRKHTDRDYEGELERLREHLLHMGARVEEMLANAMKALMERDSALAERMIAADEVGSSRVDLQACKLEYSIVSPK